MYIPFSVKETSIRPEIKKENIDFLIKIYSTCKYEYTY